MNKRKYVVRVTHRVTPHYAVPTDDRSFDNPFVECLRYAGLVVVHNEYCFDILPHQEANSKIWAEANAARMQSFGYNAVCAPARERI